jgi:uncharacterized protein (DUF1800 family)
MTGHFRRLGLSLSVAALVAACGAGAPDGGAPAPAAAIGTSAPAAANGSPAPATPLAPPVGTTAPAPGASAPGAAAPAPALDLPADASAASRFLGKSTFGATQTEIDSLMSAGYSAWIDAQFTKSSKSHLTDFAERTATLTDTSNGIPAAWLQQSFWRSALTGEDVLRQRVAFALSQILVISQANPDIGPRMAAAYYDVLTRNAFGDFRTLLEEVTLSPAMGLYLSHLGNRKEDLATGRLPDENYAREVMQLFTIGLYELNPDGSLKLDARREPIETYGMPDIAGLARVFTGFSWGGPDTSSARFVNRLVGESTRDIIPLQGYPDFHEPGTKSFLGTTVTASRPMDSLKLALDHLVAHPNVGPFIGKQLIQRLVTSNPSPAYVARVSAAFDNNGVGRRGDLKAVIRAVLLDPEAFAAPADRLEFDGRLREPLLRMSAVLRATGARSVSGQFVLGATDDPATSLGQSALRAPTVFNFFRPSYVPPNSALAAKALVAPELQITHEVSVAGWVNTVKSTIESGIGGTASGFTGRDIQPDYTALLAIANDPAALVDRVVLLLAPGQVPTDLRNRIRAEVASVAIPATNPTNIATARRNRVNLALLLLTASPEFLVQR